MASALLTIVIRLDHLEQNLTSFLCIENTE